MAKDDVISGFSLELDGIAYCKEDEISSKEAKEIERKVVKGDWSHKDLKKWADYSFDLR